MSDQPLITEVALSVSVVSALAFLAGFPLIAFPIIAGWQSYSATPVGLWVGFGLLSVLSLAVVTFTATGVEGRFLRGTLPEQQDYTGREMLEMNDDGTYGEQP
jgi:membrane protein implicated in regulation of membrane protease activity